MQVRRAADRFCTRTDWLTSWHSFSYGPWYDPANVGFGALVVSNHDELAPGAGFDDHAHRGVDLVTYVVAGRLAHRDSTGHEAVVGAGGLQVLRAGSGVRHSERNASDAEPVEYVQMWLRADPAAAAYEKVALPDGISLPGGRLSLVRLGAEVVVQGAAVHAYVAAGSATVGGIGLAAGDAVRLVDEDATVTSEGTLLVWRLAATGAVGRS